MKRLSMGARRALAATAVLTLGLGLAGCGGKADAESGEADQVPGVERLRNVRVLALAATPLEEYLHLSGPAEPLRAAVLSAEEGGRVESVSKDKGRRVRAGETLLGLDRRLLAADLEAARAALDLARFNEERVRHLRAENAVSELDYEQARADLRRAAAALKAAELRHERAVLIAPFDGVVADRYVEPGELLAPGTPVMRILDPYVLKLECDVTERDVTELSEGMEALVEFAGSPEARMGRVHWVGFAADPSTGKFPVEVRVDNPDLGLRPGVMGRARVMRALHEDVIAIPRDAVVERSGGPAAFVVEDGMAVERPLSLGPDQGLMVVVAEGLAPGDRLVVRGQRELREGMAVKVTEESRRPDGGLPGDPAVLGAGGDGR